MNESTAAFVPVAESVRQARRFVIDTLAGWGSDAGDDASLLVSELATNAVIHAGTDYTVTITMTAEVLRVSVADGSAASARRCRYGDLAATGHLARSRSAKSRHRPRARVSGVDLAEILIIGVPPLLARQAQQHFDELSREFLHLANSDESSRAGIPGRLIALSDDVRTRFGSSGDANIDLMDAAADRVDEFLDLNYQIPAAAGPAAAELNEIHGLPPISFSGWVENHRRREWK